MQGVAPVAFCVLAIAACSDDGERRTAAPPVTYGAPSSLRPCDIEHLCDPGEVCFVGSASYDFSRECLSEHRCQDPDQRCHRARCNGDAGVVCGPNEACSYQPWQGGGAPGGNWLCLSPP